MSTVWKAIPSVLMLGALAAGFGLRAPREPARPRELRQLVAAVAALYAVGVVALLMHRTLLAAVVFGTGLGICALALWLARGHRPPGADDPGDDDGSGGGGHGGRPPTDPAPAGPDVDWSYFEEQFREPVA